MSLSSAPIIVEPQTLALLRYLNADKRIYFYCRKQSIIDELRKQYYLMINNSSIYHNNNCTDCGISISSRLSDNIKDALSQHQKIDWCGYVTSIKFFRGDPEYSNSFSAELYCKDDTDFFYDIWLHIQRGYNTRDEFGLSPEQQLGLDILDYENKNIQTLSKILTMLQSYKTYYQE